MAPLANVPTESGSEVRVLHGGRQELRPEQPVKLSRGSGGETHITISAENADKFAYLLAHQCRRLKINPEQLQNEVLQEIPTSERTLFSGDLGSDEHFRSVAKMGVAAIVKEMHRRSIDIPEFNSIAEYVSQGVDANIVRDMDPASRSILRQFANSLVGEHMLAVFEIDGHTEVAFAAFGVFVFRLLLAPCVVGIDGCIVHVVNPQKPDHRIRRIDSAPTMPSIDSVAVDAEEMKKALLELHEAIDKYQKELWCTEIADDTMRRVMAYQKKPQSSEEFRNLIAHMTAQVVSERTHLRIRTIDPEDMRERVIEALTKLK